MLCYAVCSHGFAAFVCDVEGGLKYLEGALVVMLEL